IVDERLEKGVRGARGLAQGTARGVREGGSVAAVADGGVGLDVEGAGVRDGGAVVQAEVASTGPDDRAGIVQAGTIELLIVSPGQRDRASIGQRQGLFSVGEGAAGPLEQGAGEVEGGVGHEVQGAAAEAYRTGAAPREGAGDVLRRAAREVEDRPGG